MHGAFTKELVVLELAQDMITCLLSASSPIKLCHMCRLPSTSGKRSVRLAMALDRSPAEVVEGTEALTHASPAMA